MNRHPTKKKSNPKKEKSSSNGDSRPSQPAVKRSRTATPTPVSSGKAARLDGGGKMNHSAAAAAAAMDNKSFRVGQVTVNPPTPSVHQADMFVGDEEEDPAAPATSQRARMSRLPDEPADLEGAALGLITWSGAAGTTAISSHSEELSRRSTTSTGSFSSATFTTGANDS